MPLAGAEALPRPSHLAAAGAMGVVQSSAERYAPPRLFVKVTAMPLYYRLADYARYRERVGDATYLDLTRRTDSARIPQVWDHLREVVDAYGAPWVLQILTKDAAGVLERGASDLRRLRDAGTTITLQLTVTGLAGTVWEPLVPPNGLRRAVPLIDLIGGPDHVTWRYDPIIPTVHDADRYRRLAAEAADLGIRRGVINYLAPPGRYRRVDARIPSLLPGWAEGTPRGVPRYDAGWQQRVARELVDLAGEVGISLACCAESAPLAGLVPGLGRAACGDHAWFAALSGRHPPSAKGRGSRTGCGCAPYFDLGNYGLWSRCHRCAYCYAG